MARVYVLCQGNSSIAHSYGASNYDRRQIVAVYDNEEKVINHIKENVVHRVDLLADRYEEFPDLVSYEEHTKLVYARNSDYRATECLYYYYESYDVQ